MEIKNIKISELRPAEYNPRKWNEKVIKYLKESIKRFGLVDPLIVNSAENRKNILIGGHFRLQVARELGYEEVPVVYVNIPDEQKERELNLRLNKNLGEWDLDLGEKEDEVPEPRKETDIKYGDIFQLGSHRLMCGDATKKDDVDKLMIGEKADMVFTDPPYNVNYKGGANSSRTPILNDNLGDNFIDFLRIIIANMIDVCDGAFYVCMSSKELGNLKNVFEELGGHCQSSIIWVKNNFTLSNSDYQNLYEPIMYGWNKKHYFIQDRDKGNVWEDLSKVKTEYNGEYTTISFQGFKVRIKGKVEEGQVIRKYQKVDIWRYDKPIKSEEHPTMKPVVLCEEAIRNSSEMRDIVLDLFGGSGSTLIACEKLDRRCFTMEIDPLYCQVIIDRWEKLTNQKAKKLN